jgi:vacuolar-type H+-ATPase subunit H
MNENRIQQVLMIEKEAQEIADAALREAEQLPVQAEHEAQKLIEKARAEAQEEARKLIAAAQSQEASAKIETDAEEKVKLIQKSSSGNIDRAVSFVVDRVAGKE